jgi:hypothetical protein
MISVIKRRPSPAVVLSLVALFVALGGTSYAATKLLPKNSVGSAQVVNHSLLNVDFKSGQLPRGATGPQGPAGPAGPQGPASIVNVGRVQLTAAEVDPAARSEVKAFIPTNSTSGKCLVTLSESNSARSGTTVYCGNRTFNGANGIFVHIFGSAPFPSDLTVDMTIYQEAAQQYGGPVFYPLS